MVFTGISSYSRVYTILSELPSIDPYYCVVIEGCMGRHMQQAAQELWCEEQKYIVGCGVMPSQEIFLNFRGRGNNQVVLRANLEDHLGSLCPLSRPYLKSLYLPLLSVL